MREVQFREAIREAMSEEMRRDEDGEWLNRAALARKYREDFTKRQLSSYWESDMYRGGELPSGQGEGAGVW